MEAVIEKTAASHAATGAPVLEISDLHAWYGESHILHGVNLTVNKGEVLYSIDARDVENLASCSQKLTIDSV